jgi:hypothetical protein
VVSEDQLPTSKAGLNSVFEKMPSSRVALEVGTHSSIEAIAKRYAEMELLTQVYGVGTLIALTYILTIVDAQRFEHSRDVGPYLGLTRKQRDSGDCEPELGISKAGDRLLRSLLVQEAHCILRRGAPDSDLKAWGQARLENGGKKGNKKRKKKAVVAVARKRGVSLHRLWVTEQVYDPTARSRQTVGKQATGSPQVVPEMAAPRELRKPMGAAAESCNESADRSVATMALETVARARDAVAASLPPGRV